MSDENGHVRFANSRHPAVVSERLKSSNAFKLKAQSNTYLGLLEDPGAFGASP